MNEDIYQPLQRRMNRQALHLILAPVQVPASSAQSHVQIAAQPAAALARILCILIRQVFLHHLSAHADPAESDRRTMPWALAAHLPAVILCSCAAWHPMRVKVQADDLLT